MRQTGNPFWILLHSWSTQPFPYWIRDYVVNVLLYVPLGFAAHAVFRKIGGPGFSLYGPVLLGLLLSTAMELTQLLEPVRHTSIEDVITNVIGSCLGAMAGLLFEGLSSPAAEGVPARENPSRITDRGALMLSFCWVAWLFFPLFPALSIYVLSRKLMVVERSPALDPIVVISYAAAWIAGGFLLRAAGARIAGVWFLVTLLAIPAGFLIVDRQPSLSMAIGAAAGVAWFLIRDGDGHPSGWEASLFLAVILVRGLAPFHFVAAAKPFIWIPFVATLTGEWQSSAGILLEKVFYYGAAVWLFQAAGLRLAYAATLVSAVLASIEVLQMHLPGRTPEITDPVLALLMGFVLAMLARPGHPAAITLSRETETRFRSAE
jgi:VanZ family protein